MDGNASHPTIRRIPPEECLDANYNLQFILISSTLTVIPDAWSEGEEESMNLKVPGPLSRIIWMSIAERISVLR